MSAKPAQPKAPPPPKIRLSLGVTGHRVTNAAYGANAGRIEATLSAIFDQIAKLVAAEPLLLGADAAAPIRLHSLLADGADQAAANAALARGWELVAPLPFGRALNIAINAGPETPEDARALLDGATVKDAAVAARAAAIQALTERARTFELADRDAEIAALLLAKLQTPEPTRAGETFAAISSECVANAARIFIEQSDVIIGVWDGAATSFVGGTGHTIAAALDLGAPVIWIDPASPENWRILRASESLAAITQASSENRDATLAALVHDALCPAASRTPHAHGDANAGLKTLDTEIWRPHSNPLSHAYRRIEAVFGGGKRPFRNLRQTYETPDAIAAGSGAQVLAAITTLPGADPAYGASIETSVLRRFAWADGVSAYLSDAYRGGMIANFVLSSLAIVAGIAYLPFATSDEKGYFASVELILLAAILVITWLGQKRRWHKRWFETRRVAEYFRHSPILLALGVARAPGQWPKGAETSWPEWYARHGLRDVGLPRIAVTPAYLRAAIKDLLEVHVVLQRDYHRRKAERLNNVHANLDNLSEISFQLAVASVATFLIMTGASMLSLVPNEIVYKATKGFTFLGVMLPTFGAAIAGIRYFGDFERFANISEVTAEKLDAVRKRIELLLTAPDAQLTYSRTAELARATDDIVNSEIESWQAVFGGKHITVPV